MCFVLRDEVDEFDNHHSGFWRSLVALNCQNTSQNACHGCEKCNKKRKSNPIRIFFMTDENFGGSV